MRYLGFDERIRGSHHVYRKRGIPEKVNMQRDDGNAKPYLRRRGLTERIPRTPATGSPPSATASPCAAATPTAASSDALAAVADDRAPPELGHLVRRFDHHVGRLWEGRKMAT